MNVIMYRPFFLMILRILLHGLFLNVDLAQAMQNTCVFESLDFYTLFKFSILKRSTRLIRITSIFNLF